MNWMTRRLPSPSIELLLISYLFLIAFIVGLTWPWPDDPDIWWHLKTGEWMATHGTVMWTDPFGANTRGAPSIAPSWLAEILFYYLNRVDPLWGLRVLQGLVVAATTTILLVHAWLASRSLRLSLLFSMLFLIPVITWVARPQIFSFMFVALTMLLLWWGQNRNPRAWWILPPLVLLWANLHVYFIVGLGLIVLVLGLPWLRWLVQKRAPDQKPPTASLGVLGLAILAPLINPYGYHLYGELGFMAVHASSSWAAQWITELQSPNFHEWPWMVFFGWIAMALLAFHFSGKRPANLTLFLFLGLLYQTLQHSRDLPYFLIVLLPIIVEHVARFPGQKWHRLLKTDGALRLFYGMAPMRFTAHWILLFAAIMGLVAVYERWSSELPLPATGFSSAARYMLKERPPAPIYNSLNNGGYLIYALWPTYQVFIDGRTGLYSDRYWQEHNDIRHGRPGWHEKLLASKACTVIWDKEAPLASLLQLKSEWNQVYEDEKAVIFVRKQCL